MFETLLTTPAEQAVEQARAHVHDLSTDELLTLARAAMTEVAERARTTPSTGRDPRGEYEHLAGESQALLNSAQAIRTIAIGRYASVDEHPDQPGELTQRPLGHQAEFADSDLAPTLRVTPRTASWMTRDACTAVTVVPRLVRLAGTGAVSMYTVTKVADLLEHTTPDIRTKVEQRLLDSPIETATTVKVLRWVRRWLLDLDTDALSDSATKERKQKVDLRFWPGDLPGLTDLFGTLPTSHAAQITTAIDTLAQQLHADPANAGKTMGECRADALLQLVMANVTCHIQLTLLGLHPSLATETTPDAAGEHAKSTHDHSQRRGRGSNCGTCCSAGHSSDSDHGQEWAPNDQAFHDPGDDWAYFSDDAWAASGDDCALVVHDEDPWSHADFIAYLDDWCARAAVPGSLEEAIARADIDEAREYREAFAVHYDPEAFEAWFASIAAAADHLDDAPFDATDHGEYLNRDAHDNEDGRGGGSERAGSLASATPTTTGRQQQPGGDAFAGTIPGYGHLPADQLHELLDGRRATVRHALIEESGDGPNNHRLVGITTATRPVLTPATLEALARFTATDRCTKFEVTADTTSPNYRVPANIRRFVELRDEHCRYPACTRAARYCEVDHVIPWGTPGGETTPTNLQLLCTRHHRAKTAKRWNITMTRDGECTWTSPTGTVYVTRPGLTLLD